MKKLLEQLIQFESDKDHPKEIEKSFLFVENYLKKAGLKTKIYTFNGKFSLVAATKLKKHYQYILNGHLDVVPANYPNAFQPLIKENRLFGRGTSDMKGTVASMIEVICDPDLKNIDVAIMLNSDEETGGFDGVNYLVNKEGYSCDCVIVPDGGDNFELVLAEKGVLHIKISASGIAAHGSRPWLGENAIEKLISVFQEIKTNLPETKPENRWLPTVNLGKINGGDAINKVPSLAEMFLDFRYPQRKQRITILNLIKKVIKSKKNVIFEIISDGEVLETPPNNPYIKKALNIAKSAGINLKTVNEHGASDGRFFSAKGIPVLMFKPICSPAHVDNEWVDLESLKKFSEVLKEFLLK